MDPKKSTRCMFDIVPKPEIKISASTVKTVDAGTIIVSVSGGRDAIKSTKYSEKEISDLLTGYIQLPPKSWTALDRGAHVRYVRQDGRFVRGGFVSGYSTQNGRQLMTLANGFNATSKGYSVWTIGLDGIKHIYAKKNAVPSSSRVAASLHSQPKSSEITTLKKTLSDLEKRLKKLEG